MEENQINPVETEVVESAQDYITAIKELKKNSVDKAKYDELLAEKKALINNFVNGKEDSTESTQVKREIDDIRKEWLSGEQNNLEYWKTTLELRDRLIEEGDRDPFLPYGQNVLPTQEDVECANRVASVVKECIEYAEGDSAVFTNELQRRTIDVKVR